MDQVTPAETQPLSSRDDIGALCQRLQKAHLDKHAGATIDCYSPDAVLYTMAPPLKVLPDLAVTQAWLDTFAGQVVSDDTDAALMVGGDLAWSTSLTRMRGTKTDSATVDM